MPKGQNFDIFVLDNNIYMYIDNEHKMKVVL